LLVAVAAALLTAPSAGAATARLVRDINPDAGNSTPVGFTALNGIAYFGADDGTNGEELWQTNGTEAGTGMVKNLAPGSSSGTPREIAAVNGSLFFSARVFFGLNDLYRSDGTAGGTGVVDPDDEPQLPAEITPVGGAGLFRASAGGDGFELWRTDGTPEGTQQVRDIADAAGVSSFPEHLTNVGGVLYFAADDGIRGVELWRSDGTAAGTRLVKNINTGDAGAADSDPADLVDVNGTLYFSARDSSGGNELWKSNGTAEGSDRVRYINTGAV
jgi:ELWxxDGT repeat protein